MISISRQVNGGTNRMHCKKKKNVVNRGNLLSLVLWVIFHPPARVCFQWHPSSNIQLMMTCPSLDSHLNTASSSRCPVACKTHSSRRAPSIVALLFFTYTQHCKINVRRTNAFSYDSCRPHHQYRGTPYTAHYITSPDVRYERQGNMHRLQCMH